MNMRSLPILAGLLLGSAAAAQDVHIVPLADARLRYELVDQDGFARDANALTLRIRPGVQATSGPWSALIEGEATLAIVHHNNDGSNGLTAYPLVVDPRNLELNRAQIRYAGTEGLTMTFGRQLIELADQRFVGSSNFRQNQQTFDAVRLQWGRPTGFSVDVSYAWRDRTVNGVHGSGARQTAISGDNVFALLNYRTKIGALTGFAYLIDQDEAAVQGFRLSSQTYGLRFAGSTPLGHGVTLAYTASYARQSDYRHNPNDYAANYWLGEAALTAHAFTLTGGYEVLGADRGVALTSVQTPLASFFKWQGWAGKFNPTPPNGIRDLYGTLGYAWRRAGPPVDALGLSATWHRFESDRLDQHYGNELDLVASLRHGRTTFTARYAHYRADAFATDTDKFWLSLDWAL
jgi:hypothetical protein